ncbi:sulfatase-like hydrolase/transferase, partial [Mariniblastus sp.]|nr:sulfatase-like hydrolase/transferase [Mariniblastus sp.]
MRSEIFGVLVVLFGSVVGYQSSDTDSDSSKSHLKTTDSVAVSDLNSKALPSGLTDEQLRVQPKSQQNSNLQLVGFVAGKNPSPAAKPNIVVIWGDDVGWNNPSCYNRGMMGYKTPNIDRIAREGGLFTDWYG